MKKKITSFLKNKIKSNIFSTAFAKCFSTIKNKIGNKKDTFSNQIIEKYAVPNVCYYDSAYMVFLRIKAEKKQNIVPLYARSDFIMSQVKLYVEKEKTKEIYIVKEPAEPVNIINNFPPGKFFENINLSTKREWGKIFYSFSKEYETFYEEQFHKKPNEETEKQQTVHLSERKRIEKNHIYEEEIRELHELKKQIEERESTLYELEEQITTLIHKVDVQESVIEELHQIKRELPDLTEQIDVTRITQSVMNRLQINLAQERMRHGF